jgi:uncharacterized protein (TIGR03435 family)
MTLGTIVPAVHGASAVSPAFEVASVKLSETPGGAPIRFGRDGLTLTSIDLRIALILAYDVRDFQIQGPDWLRDAAGAKRFTIVAKASHPVPEEQLRLMLRTLLAERLHLTLHRDKKEMPVIALVAGKGAPKFHPAAPGIELDSQWLGFTNVRQTPARDSEGRMRHSFTNAPMATLAAALSASMGGGVDPVVDLTGLEGRYDFALRDAPSVPAGEPPPSPEDRFAAYKTIVQDDLGLTLQRRKAFVDILVIDQADRVPMEN